MDKATGLAAVKEKEKQKFLAKEREKQLARETSQLRSITLKDITIKEEEIGRGATAVVSRVMWHGTECAVKKIHANLVVDCSDFNYVRESFIKECSICARLNHPNIVQFYGIYYPSTSKLPSLVMELMYCSLTKCLEKYPKIPVYMKLSFLHDVSLGIRYLHSFDPPIVHRDLSSNNILITRTFTAKVADLGVAKIIDVSSKGTANKLTRAPGTLDFMSPEALETEPVYDTPLDIFSFGGIVIHCMSHQWPTPKGPNVTIDPATRKVIGHSEQERRSHLIEQMGNFEQLKSLAIRCLDNVAKARPDIVEISNQLATLKAKAIHSSPIAMMNVLDKDIALNKYMSQGERDGAASVALPQASSLTETRSSSPILPPRSPNLKSKKLPFVWQPCDPMPQGMRSPKVVEFNGSIYVGGGDTGSDNSDASFKVYAFNITRRRWSVLPSTPQHWFAIAVVKRKLLVVGGADNKNAVTGKVTSWDGANSVWHTEYPPVPTGRSDPAAIGHSNYLIVVGGFDGRQSVDVVEVLNVYDNQWIRAASLPYTVTSVTPMLQGDVLYLAGGLGSNPSGKQSAKKTFSCVSIPLLLKSALAGNTTTIWKELAPIPFSHSSTSVHSETFYAFCGRDSSTKQDSPTIHMYDALKNSWSRVGDLPTCRRMCAAISTMEDTKLYIIGGSVDSVKCSNVVEYSD